MGEASPSLRELLGRAEHRAPWVPDDTKSGARFERVVIGGERFVLKYQDPRDDWILRATGDPGRVYVRLWESGLLDRLPAVIDHAVVAAEFDGTVGMVLLRDVSAALLGGDTPFTPTAARPLDGAHGRAARRLLGMAATTWASCRWTRRYRMFSPDVAAAEVARGNPARRAPGHGRGMAAPARGLARHGPGRHAAAGRPEPTGRRAGTCAAHPGPRGLEGRQPGQPPGREDGPPRLRRGAGRGLPAGGPVVVPGAQCGAPARAQGRRAGAVPDALERAASPPPGGGTTPSPSSSSAAWCSSAGRRRSGGRGTSCPGGRSGCSGGRAAWPRTRPNRAALRRRGAVTMRTGPRQTPGPTLAAPPASASAPRRSTRPPRR